MMRRHAPLVAESIFSDTDRSLRQAIDPIVAWLEMLGRQAKPAGG